MIMSNEEKDNEIRKELQKDTFVFSGNDSFGTIVTSDLESARIKPVQYTFRQKHIIIFLLILLAISILTNVYIIVLKPKGMNIENMLGKGPEPEYVLTPSTTIVDNFAEDKIEDEEIEDEETTEENEVEIIEEDEKEETTEVQELDKSAYEKNKQKFTAEVDEEMLKSELKMYALSIGRFEDIINTKEENTVLLIMAKNMLESMRTISGNKSNIGKYTLILDNTNTFIEELTGNKPSDVLESYNNYIGYSKASNSYNWGADGNPFAKEKYEVLTCEFSEKNNTEFKVSGYIEKSTEQSGGDYLKSIYHYNAIIVVNPEYEYLPYRIKSFNYSLNADSYDDIYRLYDKEVDIDVRKVN